MANPVNKEEKEEYRMGIRRVLAPARPRNLENKEREEIGYRPYCRWQWNA